MATHSVCYYCQSRDFSAQISLPFAASKKFNAKEHKEVFFFMEHGDVFFWYALLYS